MIDHTLLTRFDWKTVAKCRVLLSISVALVVIGAALAHCAPLPQSDPLAVGLDGTILEQIEGLVASEIQQEKLPGCVVMIGRQGTVAFARAFGHRQLQPTPELMTVDTVFDMASLTKPVATATSIMILVERGQLRLRDPVANTIPEFAQNGKDKITVEHLLTHQGGLIPDNPLADYKQGSKEAWNRIWALKTTGPVGKKFVYTDVGFLVLGEMVRRVTGQDVAQFAKENIFQPAGMLETGFLPDEHLRARAAPTEQREGEWLRGTVHDPRSALLDGVAGHAGLFSTADDLARYASMMLARGISDGKQILSSQTIREMIRGRNIAGQRRALGWDVSSKYSSNRGELFSRQAFGHGGFTGTAMWIDPQLDLFVIFLSNRLHPDGQGSINHLAGRIGTLAAAAIVGKNRKTSARESVVKEPANKQPGNVLTGIDVLERDNFQALANRRVGLITNHTGLDRHGKRTIDLLHDAPAVELVAIFSPEHGLQGKLDEPNVADAHDPTTNLPVYSLYGESRRPGSDRLKTLDTLVFDIQDIGTRFYTYISTMGLAMEAAAEQGLHFVVLDRPNPIGGKLVEGPVLDRGDESFVGYHPIAVRHGMTAGELARMIREERGLDLDLKVVEVEKWRRGDTWDRTGLTWINPSPNMRSLTQAIVYPGIGLLETTNLSVGRGTDTPFELFGAPWIDSQKLAAALNQQGLAGVRFVPIRFTPASSKYAGELCQGVNVIVVDRQVFRPVDVGLHIACTLRKLYADDWNMKRFNRLLINRSVLEAIQSGQDAGSLKPLFQQELDRFLARRRKFLLYSE